MTRHRLIVVLGAVCLLAALAFGQKKSYTLYGKVEAIEQSTKGLTVNHDKVEGWMDAMTMTYAVDDPGVLKKVKVGDRIKATVYDGDLTLHNVEVVAKAPDKGKGKK